MSELRFVNTKGWVAPEDGLYVYSNYTSGGIGQSSYLHKGSRLVFGRNYEEFKYVAGPITILPPEPELELPEGWEVVSENELIPDGYRMLVERGRWDAEIRVCFPTRAECVTVINRLVKAAEGR